MFNRALLMWALWYIVYYFSEKFEEKHKWNKINDKAK